MQLDLKGLTKEQRADVAAVFINAVSGHSDPAVSRTIFEHGTTFGLGAIHLAMLNAAKSTSSTGSVTRAELLAKYPDGVGDLNYNSFYGSIKINVKANFLNTSSVEKDYPGIFQALAKGLVGLGFLNDRFMFDNMLDGYGTQVPEGRAKCTALKNAHPGVDFSAPFTAADRKEMDTLYHMRARTTQEEKDLQSLQVKKEYFADYLVLNDLLAKAQEISSDTDADMYDTKIAEQRAKCAAIKAAHPQFVEYLDRTIGFTPDDLRTLNALEAKHARTPEEDKRFAELDARDDYANADRRVKELEEAYDADVAQIQYIRGLIDAAPAASDHVESVVDVASLTTQAAAMEVAGADAYHTGGGESDIE